MPINEKKRHFLRDNADLDNLTSYEEMLRHLAPVFLAVPGVILVAAGLFLWLAGLRLLRPLAAFCAAAMGLVCALAFTGRQVVPMVLFMVIPAAIALFVEKPVVVLLGACLAGLAVLAFPLAADMAFREAVIEETGAVPLVEDVSMFEARAYAEVLSEWAAAWVKAFWVALSDGYKAAAVVVPVIVLIAGLVTWRWVCALTCSALGTGMILIGLTSLVISKGTQTIPYLESMRPYVWAVAGGMVVTGTLLNRWLGPVKAKQAKSKEPHVQGDGK